MISTFKIKNHSDKNIRKEYNKGLSHKAIDEIKKTFNTNFSKSNNRELLLNGILINIRKDELMSPIIMDVAHNFPYIKLHFELEGFLQFIPSNTNGIPVIIEDGNYNFFYLPEAKGTITFNSRSRKALSILITEDYLRKTFKSYFEKIEFPFKKALENKTPYKMFSESKSIPSNLLLNLSDIISCSYQKEIKQVYLESKVKEIFSYLFSEMDSKNTHKKDKEITNLEYNQVINAEKILQENLHKNITINQLSILSGINQHKLKRNFKLVFKRPIFTYLTDARMEKAKIMLIKNKMDVSQVALAVGYKNPQHFTVAFKKRFNYLPSSLKKIEVSN